MLPNPLYTTLERWADEAVLTLEVVGTVPQLRPGQEWQNWAVSLGFLETVCGLPLPDPYQYDEWQNWALTFMAALGGPEVATV